MKIGEAAAVAGLTVKTVRYYADIGLVAPAGRDPASRYRDYGPGEVAKLNLVRRARSFGFSVDECRNLVALFENERRASADVKALALEKRAALDAQLEELQALRRALDGMIDACPGDERSNCAILDGLSGAARKAAG
ncbi:MAG: MerR family DNA-binding protein [Pseudomonadota bacterium]